MYEKLAYILPKKLCYWCAIRVFAHGTVGKYSGQIVPLLTCGEALSRWRFDSGIVKAKEEEDLWKQKQ